MSFFGFGKDSSQRPNSSYAKDQNLPVLGFTATPNQGTTEQLNQLRAKMDKVNRTYAEKLALYKKQQAYVTEISNAYIHNLKVVLDISQVMNIYMRTFEDISRGLSESEKALSELNPNDLLLLKKATNGHLKQMSQVLMTEIDKLSKIFERNGDKSKKLNLDKLMSDVSRTIQITSNSSEQRGGAKKTKTKTAPKKTTPNIRKKRT